MYKQSVVKCEKHCDSCLFDSINCDCHIKKIKWLLEEIEE
nr:MAG TPA: hypothetical protein [Caudoviricetes sp.]